MLTESRVFPYPQQVTLVAFVRWLDDVAPDTYVGDAGRPADHPLAVYLSLVTTWSEWRVTRDGLEQCDGEHTIQVWPLPQWAAAFARGVARQPLGARLTAGQCLDLLDRKVR
jgi:hypothetical protein